MNKILQGLDFIQAYIDEILDLNTDYCNGHLNKLEQIWIVL